MQCVRGASTRELLTKPRVRRTLRNILRGPLSLLEGWHPDQYSCRVLKGGGSKGRT